MSEQALDRWVGSTERMADTLDPVHAARIAATLGVAAPAEGQALPPLWQWAYFIKTVDMAGLGGDGHPARGGFLPPADDRNRMWAGGRVAFHQPLKVGVPAERVSTVADIKEKTGRTGSLLFVTVRMSICSKARPPSSKSRTSSTGSPRRPSWRAARPRPRRNGAKPSSPARCCYSATRP